MTEFRRGTTPILKFTTPEQNWNGFEVWLTLEEGEYSVTIKNERLTILGTDIWVTLTQEETLKFNKTAQVQIKGKNGNAVAATDIQQIKVLPILNEGLM